MTREEVRVILTAMIIVGAVVSHQLLWDIELELFAENMHWWYLTGFGFGNVPGLLVGPPVCLMCMRLWRRQSTIVHGPVLVIITGVALICGALRAYISVVQTGLLINHSYICTGPNVATYMWLFLFSVVMIVEHRKMQKKQGTLPTGLVRCPACQIDLSDTRQTPCPDCKTTFTIHELFEYQVQPT